MDHTFSEYISTERVPSHGNFVLGAIAGLAAAFVGALVWIGFAFITGWYAGPVALFIGVMVGLCVRFSGRGSHFLFRVMGVVFTLLGCLSGEMGVTLQLATTPVYDLYGVLIHTDLVSMASSIINGTSPLMMVVYAIGAVEAYQLSAANKS